VEFNANAGSAPGGFSFGTLSIRTPHDFVSLSRRTRVAGEDFGLDARDVRRLAAATYETARLLSGVTGVEAEVRLADGPALQVVFSLPIEDETQRSALLGRLDGSLASVKPLVNRLAIERTEAGISVCLLALFPTGATQRSHALSSEPPATAADPDPQASHESLREQYSLLQQDYRDLQSELEETNSGVVAVYAELEDQADRLREAEDRLRLLLDSVHDYAICMLSPEGEVTSWNAGGERLFAYSADEIIGRSFACFYPAAERDLGLPAEHLREAQERGRHEGECLRLRHGGGAFDAHVVLTPVRRNRELRGFSLVVRDITERKRLEDDLRRRAEDLATANRAKEDFLATLSHELRTPLNAMLGWTRLLRMGKLDQSAVSRALETIERNAHVQEQLIGDILDVSRIVTGKLRLELAPIDLAPVLEAAIDAVRPAAEAKGLRLAYNVDFSGTVLGDPDRLQQVVWNLLANAIKFTSAGWIRVSLERQGPSAVITVEDSGEGIPEDLLPFIFDRFRQGDGSATRPHGGLGLGLSIVRHLVELHGGRVQARSGGRGKGAAFSVHLPLRAIQTPAAEGSDASEQPLSGVKVLVLDDDADAREVVSTALAQCGAKTVAAGTPREALVLLREFAPDVLVSDIAMPGEDGFAFIKRVRALAPEGIGSIPAVALSAHHHDDEMRHALTAGFQEFVPKPVEMDELAAIVLTLAKRR
jgi:PAS domain S-box-containing protein